MEFIARLKSALLMCIQEVVKSEAVEAAASLSKTEGEVKLQFAFHLRSL